MRKSYWLFIVTLVFSPLAFGAVEDWSLALMEILALFSLLLYLFRVRNSAQMQYYETPGIVPLLCFLGFILFQILPLPAELVRILSPVSYDIYENSIGAAGRLTWIPLSLDPKSTLSEFLRFSSYAALYILAVQLLSREKYLRRTFLLITVFAAALALFGMFQGLMPNGKIYWFREVATKFIYGPFANRNHFAGFMAMVFPLAVALFLTLKPAVVYGSLRNRLSDMLSQRNISAHILSGACAVVIAASVFMSLSRGGIISFCVSFVILVCLLFLRSGTRKKTPVVVISLLIILAIAWLGWRQVAERFDSLKNVTSIVRIHTADRPDRIEMWKDSTKIIKDFYAAGSGLGAFEKVYPKYRVFWTDYAIDHAHNDYLELLAEGGITGFLFAACFIITLLYRSFIIIPLRKDINSIYLHTGCVAGIFSMLVFSLTDFNLHIGANGLYFFLLCALAVSSAHTRLHKGLEPTYLRKLKPGRAAPLRAVVMIVFALCVIINGGVLAGKYFFSSFDRNRPSDKTDAARLAALGSDIRKASLFDPLNAKYYYTSGLIERGLGNAEASITLLDYAATLDPMNGEYLQRLGLSLFEKGRTEAGDRLIRAATIHDAANPDRQRFYAVHLFMTGKKEAAAECIRRALLMAPDRTADFIILMMLRGMTDDEIQKTLPDRAAPHIAFAEYLAQTNKHAAAEQEFREALGYAAKEKSTSRDYFLRAYNYYVKRERFDDALWTMKQAIILFPNEGSLYYTIGTLYERLGMDTTAIDAYKKAVSLDVTQSDAQKRTDVLMRKAGKRD